MSGRIGARFPKRRVHLTVQLPTTVRVGRKKRLIAQGSITKEGKSPLPRPTRRWHKKEAYGPGILTKEKKAPNISPPAPYKRLGTSHKLRWQVIKTRSVWAVAKNSSRRMHQLSAQCVGSGHIKPAQD